MTCHAPVELADTFMLRAAAFPLNHLLALGTASVDALRDAADPNAREIAYAALLDQERRALYARTCHDGAFLKALTLTHPDVAERAAKLDPDRARTKRVRHLDTTLFRYLSRATTRATPGDLWAGVAVAVRGERDELEERPATISCEPDLRPMAAIFNAVVASRGDDLAHMLNPTVQVDGDQVRFVTPDARTHGLAFEGAGAVVTCLRARGSATPAAHAATLHAAWPGVDTGRLVAELVDRGLLLSSVRFPYRFASVWEALERAQALLPENARAAWHHCVAALREICQTIERRYPTAAVDDLVLLREQAARCIAATALALGVDVEAPRSPIRTNLRVGYRLRLGPETWQALRLSCREFIVYQQQLAIGPALSEVTRASFKAAFPETRRLLPLPVTEPFRTDARSGLSAPTWEQLGRHLRACPALHHRLDRTAELLAHEGAAVTFEPDASEGLPLGAGSWAILAGLRLGSRPRLRALHALVPHPYSLHGRFTAVLGADPDAGRLGRWLSGRLLREAATGAAETVEVVGPFDHIANVLSRPAIGLPTLDPWHPNGGDIQLSDIEVRAGRLVHGPTGKPIAAHWLSAANPPDALTEALVSTTGYPLRPLRFETAALPLEVETGRARTPEVKLQGGARIRPSRSVITGDPLQALLTTRDKSARFVSWLALAEARDWPRLVRVRRAGRPPLVIPTRSALALEALLEGVRWKPDTQLIVEAFDADVGIRLPDGRHHVAELAVFACAPDASAGGVAA